MWMMRPQRASIIFGVNALARYQDAVSCWFRKKCQSSLEVSKKVLCRRRAALQLLDGRELARGPHYDERLRAQRLRLLLDAARLLLVGAGVDDHVRAAGGELEHDRAADIPARAGHEDGLARKVEILVHCHVFSRK